MRTTLLLGILLTSCGDDPAAATIDDPGRVTVHRLNRAEYDNTVRDLFATAQRPAQRFPVDDFTLGFSNNASTLTLSSTLLELYEIAADDLLAEISTGSPAPTTTLRVEGEAATGDGVSFGTVRNVWTGGPVTFTVDVPEAGWWNLSILGTAAPAASVALTMGGTSVGEILLGDTALAPSGATLEAGIQTVTLTLVDPGDPDDYGAPVVALDAIELTGPIGALLPPGPGRALVFTCDPSVLGEAPCAEQIVRDFGRRAWRRPLAADEFERVMGLYGEARGAGESWEASVLWSLKGLLLAPWFVYRVEVDPAPESSEPRPLNAYELASRLSYFLWSSMPDDELLDLAESGALTQTATLSAQVDRMLHDPKAMALVDTLGVEWLYLSRIDEATPDAVTFPAFDDLLRTSMKEELQLFTANVLLNDRSMLELLTGTDTWIDARLAAHYGMEPPATAGFVQVQTPDRPGIIGRAGWLTALSYPTRTSPVRRGKWVVENLMCEPPAPPPPGTVLVLPGDADEEVTQSVREQLEAHRANPVCAGCHVVMDGIGFGLENFDGIGQFREDDAFGNPIDANGSLVTGETFVGAAALGAVLAEEPKVAGCMVQKTFTFALGRTLRPEDLVFVDDVTADFVASGHRFSSLATGIVLSDAFRYRTPGAEGSP